MKIKEVRNLYPKYKISFLPKKDYLIGIDDSKTLAYKKRRKDLYNEVYIAKDNEDKYYLLYPTNNSITGSFINRQKAIDWFKKGGR
jgi:ribonuclease HII